MEHSEIYYQQQIIHYRDKYIKYDSTNPIPQAMDIYPYLNSRTRNEDYFIILNCLKEKKVIPPRIMLYAQNHIDKLKYLKKRIIAKEKLNNKYLFYRKKYKAEYPNSAPQFLNTISK